MPKGLVVAEIERGSIAEEMEMQAGDRVLAVNDLEVNDIVDFQTGVADEEFRLLVEKPNGEIWELDIEREPGEFLGVGFDAVSAEGLKVCRNNCVFCFVAQMPKGLRATLYQKDDDYRLSLTQGSFITLSNLAEEEIDRIIRLRLSPLYVSVHAWDPEVRARLMQSPRAGKLPEQMKRLAEAGLTIHAQIVLVPDYNDGAALMETVRELGKLYPALQSIAVVPVGLTRYRQRLTPLRGFTAAEAKRILEQGEKWQKEFLARLGRRLVYFADEFYILAEREFPTVAAYDDFPQLENGVGLVSKFNAEAEELLEQLPGSIPERRVHLLTGVSAQALFELWGKRLSERVKGLKFTVHGIRNDFFGPSVTAAGLVTARDILRQLGGLSGEEFLIPRVMLKADEDIFLDDRSVEWLEEKLGGKARIVENNGQSFLEHVLGCPLEVRRFE